MKPNLVTEIVPIPDFDYDRVINILALAGGILMN